MGGQQSHCLEHCGVGTAGGWHFPTALQVALRPQGPWAASASLGGSGVGKAKSPFQFRSKPGPSVNAEINQQSHWFHSELRALCTSLAQSRTWGYWLVWRGTWC